MRNVLLFGWSFGSIAGASGVGAAKELAATGSLLVLVNWIFLYGAYVVLASGVLFGMYALLWRTVKVRDFRLFGWIVSLAVLFFALAAANHSNPTLTSGFGRPIGRYVDAVLPMFVTLGFVAFERAKVKRVVLKRLVMVVGVFLLFAAQLAVASLFPFNNASLTLVGVAKYGLDVFFVGRFVGDAVVYSSFVVLAAVLGLSPLLFLRRARWQPYLVMAFVVVSSVLAFAVTYENARRWHGSEQMRLGMLLNELDPDVSRIVFDERDCVERLSVAGEGICELTRRSTIAGFWLNDEIVVGDVYAEDYDLVVSKHHLGFERVNDLKGEVFAYRP